LAFAPAEAKDRRSLSESSQPLLPQARAVVVPLGVPDSSRGLGLGIAALVHGFARAFGQGVALAQLHGKPAQEGGVPRPVESLIPAGAWRDLVTRGQAPDDVEVVITGHFEPPGDGAGLLQVLVFEAKTGALVARGEAHVDGAGAGAAVVSAFEQAWVPLQGDLGGLRELADLSWDALESVLKAERCALFDPIRGGPHDCLAALAHLGRAVDEAPNCRYPAARLAALAIDAALGPNAERRVMDAALRTMERAAADAPAQVDLLEAAAALHVRVGDASQGEVLACRALGLDPKRGRLRALLSEARRSQGNFEGALEATAPGLVADASDPLLLTERGVVLAAQGHFGDAAASWRAALSRDRFHAPAFASLARLAAMQTDTTTMQSLVDHALSLTPSPPPETLRQALELAMLSEPDGVARAARMERLARALLASTPRDGWATLALARSLVKLGDLPSASALLVRLEVDARESLAGAEAQLGRFALANADEAEIIDATLRSAETAAVADLEAVVVRARRLADAHALWTAYLAAGIALRRLGRHEAARGDLLCGIVASPGAAPLFAELARACAALSLPQEALEHADRARALAGDTPKTMLARYEALRASGRTDEAAALATDAAARFPDDADLAIAVQPAGPITKAGLLARWFSRK
jgi:tetratricopeptide (TPR) repeat protein